MKCKVRLMCAVELFVEGSSEDAIQDWLNKTTPEQAYLMADGGDVEYNEEILCCVADNSEVDYVIKDGE